MQKIESRESENSRKNNHPEELQSTFWHMHAGLNLCILKYILEIILYITLLTSLFPLNIDILLLLAILQH